MVFQRYENNGSEKYITGIGMNFSISKKMVFIKTNSSYSLLVPFFLNVFYLFQKFVYLSFNVTTASTIVRIVTTQNLTAILLS